MHPKAHLVKLASQCLSTFLLQHCTIMFVYARVAIIDLVALLTIRPTYTD